jgi:hypothetical protein
MVGYKYPIWYRHVSPFVHSMSLCDRGAPRQPSRCFMATSHGVTSRGPSAVHIDQRSARNAPRSGNVWSNVGGSSVLYFFGGAMQDVFLMSMRVLSMGALRGALRGGELTVCAWRAVLWPLVLGLRETPLSVERRAGVPTVAAVLLLPSNAIAQRTSTLREMPRVGRPSPLQVASSWR